MIGIRNLGALEGEGRDGWHRYEVRINLDRPTACFVHRRSDGLAECLHLAAEAVERREMARPIDIREIVGKKNTPENLTREEK